MPKNAYYILAAVIVAIGGYAALSHSNAPAPAAQPVPVAAPVATDTSTTNDDAGKVSGATSDSLLTDGTYNIVVADSLVNWEGRKTLIANYKDTGTLGIKEGSFSVANGLVNSGKVSFDMTTITPTIITKVGNESMLAKHLKSDSFFSVDKFPSADFAIKSVVADATTAGAYTITGDLTIKGISHEVSFPATATSKDGALVIDAKTDLDRTLWDIRFGSAKFFDNLANNVIDDKFTVTLHLTAKPAATI